MTSRMLGKRPARHDSRTLQLARYATFRLGPAPSSRVWSTKVRAWPMSLNDTISDCAIAAPGHQVQAWTANGQAREVDVTDTDVLRAYEAVSGYVPGNDATDTGCVMLDVMNYWRKFGIGGHKIAAFVSVSPGSTELVKDGINLFGGLSVGLALPASAQDQAVWDVPAGGPRGAGEPGSWGGHAVCVLDYDPRGLTCVTWGDTLRMTWAFWNTYVDEAYAALSTDFLTRGRAPHGLDVVALRRDLAAL